MIKGFLDTDLKKVDRKAGRGKLNADILPAYWNTYLRTSNFLRLPES